MCVEIRDQVQTREHVGHRAIDWADTALSDKAFGGSQVFPRDSILKP